jgi:hypothetical protein
VARGRRIGGAGSKGRPKMTSQPISVAICSRAHLLNVEASIS